MLKTITDFGIEGHVETTPYTSIEPGFAIINGQTTVHPHLHAGQYEILYVQNGHGLILYQGQEYHAEAGDVVIFRRDAVHAEDWRGTQEMPLIFYCIFSKATYPFEEDAIALHPVLSTGIYQKQVARLAWAIDLEYHAQKMGSGQVCEALVDNLLMIIVRLLRERMPAQEEELSTLSIARQARLYIDRNFAGRITLEVLATQVHASVYHLAHAFKKEHDVSPIQYLNRTRIERARLLLTTTEYTVAEIMEQVGFDNLSGFNRMFKRFTGMTPSKLRKSNAALLQAKTETQQGL